MDGVVVSFDPVGRVWVVFGFGFLDEFTVFVAVNEGVRLLWKWAPKTTGVAL